MNRRFVIVAVAVALGFMAGILLSKPYGTAPFIAGVVLSLASLTALLIGPLRHKSVEKPE